MGGKITAGRDNLVASGVSVEGSGMRVALSAGGGVRTSDLRTGEAGSTGEAGTDD
jgi:hypothetical protein